MLCPMPRGPIGLVLSGGGARGAYEAGVLLYLAREMPEVLERIEILAGSSAGAVNVAYLASQALEPEAVERLAELWGSLKLDETVAFAGLSTLKALGAAPLALLRGRGGSPAYGLLDPTGLFKVVGRETRFKAIHRHIASGRFRAVALTATDIGLGDSVVFFDGHQDLRRGGHHMYSDFTSIPTELQLRHVLASAAIPVLFPPVNIGDRWYMDGGVRDNTPLSPALRLGAESLLIVNVRGVEHDTGPLPGFPGLRQVIAKLLDSLFLDRVGFDLDRLARLNDLVEIVEGLGDEARDQFYAGLAARGRPPYRRVPFAAIAPDRDVGDLAAEFLQASAAHSGALSYARVLSSLFKDPATESGDAVSFLLFDGPYAAKLVEIGYEDAGRCRAQLEQL